MFMILMLFDDIHIYFFFSFSFFCLLFIYQCVDISAAVVDAADDTSFTLIYQKL
jgi:hypothetical protein